MEWDEVRARIESGEDERTEFDRFRSFDEKDWLEAVADDGSLDGVPMDNDTVREWLANFLQNGLSSPVQSRTGHARHDDRNIHWVEVARMRGPEPLRHRGRVYVRRGRADVEPSSSELQELYNSFGLIFTEERVIPGTTIDDIDAQAFRRFLKMRGVDLQAAPQLPLETDLVNREVLGHDMDGVARATLFGMLCFGIEPERLTPLRNFWVDLVAYAGPTCGHDVLISGSAKGRLDEQVRLALTWLKALGKTERYEDGRRIDEWVVPLAAFRECVVNAVVHRDYTILGSRVLVEVFSDRVVVMSPGALPNHKRVASVLAGGTPRSRNESQANYLFDLEFMEQRGSGYPKMRVAMQAFNGTEPTLENNADERWVRVTLARKPSPSENK